MDKIRSLVNPGAKQDDEILYGSGRSSDPVHSGSLGTAAGEGEHFGNSRTTGDSSLSSDNTSTTAVKDGVAGNTQTGADLAGSSGINKPLPNEPGLTGASSGTNTTSEPHSSNLANKADPRVDSTTGASSGLTGSTLPDRTVGSSSYPQSSATDPTARIREVAHERGEGAQEPTNTSDLGSNVGREFPLVGSSSTSTGNTTTGPHSSNLASKSGPRAGSNLDGSQTAGNTGYSSTGTTTGSGHSNLGRDAALGTAAVGGAGLVEHERRDHRDNTTNLTDNGLGSSTPGTTGARTGLGSSTTGTIGSGLGSSATGTTGTGIGSTTGAGYGAESWEHQHTGHGHQFTGDPCESEHSAVGGAPHFTHGPHATDTANRLDPHVSDTNATSTESADTTGVQHHGRHGHHHEGRDAAVASGVGATGVGAYEADRHHDKSTPTSIGATTGTLGSASAGGAIGSSTTTDSGTTSGASTEPLLTGPVHKSSLLNKLDPRVKSVEPTSGATTSGATTSGATTSSTGSANPYNSSSVDPRVDADRTGTSGLGRDHHYGRDAAGAGALAGAGYEAEKHHRQHDQSTVNTSTTGTTGRTGISGATGTTGTTDTTGTGHSFGHLTSGDAGRERTEGTHDHHYGRDAAGGAAVTGAGYEAEKHHRHHDQPTTVTGTAGTAGTTANTSSLEYSDNLNRDRTGEHHTGKDAALGAGTVGAAGVAGHEFSKKDAEKEQKQIAKEEAKEEKALEKEQKHHDKEIAKEHKHHDKEIAKEHKQHDKEAAKEHKQHDKVVKEEEKHEKKHGGILGFLHKDKTDKGPTTAEEAESRHNNHHGAEAAAVGTGGVGAAEVAEHEKHGHNKLHKDPPASVVEQQRAAAEASTIAGPPPGQPGHTFGHLSDGNVREERVHGIGEPHYAEAPTKGYAAQVTGGTGTTALAQGDSMPRGSHITGPGDVLDPSVNDPVNKLPTSGIDPITGQSGTHTGTGHTTGTGSSSTGTY